MDKRYQVFVSSTYADLQEERRRVIQTLMEMDCIPSGMELFPAADEEQWEFIKRVIDDCDYYLLIIGGRYGSVTAEGVSYTEKEYEYALERGIKVIALLHSDPESIPIGKSEGEPAMRERLQAFRTKVMDGRLVRFWTKPDELPGLVALSLSKTITMYPATGWVRADQATSVQLLNEINDLRKQKELLDREVAQLRSTQMIEIPDLASLDDKIVVRGKDLLPTVPTWTTELTWKQLFATIAPSLLDHPNDLLVQQRLAKLLADRTRFTGIMPEIDGGVFDTIKVQFQALGLVTVDYTRATNGGMGLFWSLTKAGHSLMISLRAIRSNKESKSQDSTK